LRQRKRDELVHPVGNTNALISKGLRPHPSKPGGTTHSRNTNALISKGLRPSYTLPFAHGARNTNALISKGLRLELFFIFNAAMIETLMP